MTDPTNPYRPRGAELARAGGRGRLRSDQLLQHLQVSAAAGRIDRIHARSAQLADGAGGPTGDASGILPL